MGEVLLILNRKDPDRHDIDGKDLSDGCLTGAVVIGFDFDR